MKKHIKINFVDFWETFNHQDNFILTVLRKHYEVELCDTPDYLFYSVFGYEHLNFQGVRIFYSGENLLPDFNLCDYGIGFGHLTFEDRYVRYPLYLNYTTDLTYAKMKHQLTQDDLARKRKFCNFVYSNKDAAPIRKEIKDVLNTYKTVDSGGRYDNNIGGPVLDKRAFQEDYMFSVAFENDSTSGYTTEKLLQAFAAKTIPIYWGDPGVKDYFNEDAFIYVSSRDELMDVLETVKALEQDEKRRLQMLEAPMWTEEQAKKHEDILTELERFLLNIFDQPYEDAFRRSREFKGRQYQEERQELFALRSTFIFKVIRKLLRIVLRKK